MKVATPTPATRAIPPMFMSRRSATTKYASEKAEAEKTP